MLNRMNQRMTKRSRYWLMLAITCLAVLSAGTVPASAQNFLVGEDILNYLASLDQWPMFGQNPMNTANNLDFAISRETVGKLAPKWTFKTGGDVSARAAIVAGVAYFPDWATPATSSNLWAVNAQSGKQVWAHTLSDYGLPTPTHSRTTPAVVGGVLYLGTQEGAWLLAIDARNGNLIWKNKLETVDPYAIITTSPVVASGMVFTGTASTQEGVLTPGFVATARGSVVGVDAASGQIRWKTYTLPSSGYAGGGVWGGNPVVDDIRGTVFVGTGNNYAAPTDPAYVSCVGKGGTPASCISPNDHTDSILALDMFSGNIKWSTRLMNWNQTGITNGTDFWDVNCLYGLPYGCPTPTGPDYDFGSAPNEITYFGRHGLTTILGAGQKSGIYYALDPDTGQVIWHTQVGPGSALGGMEWGSASDGERIYVAISNLNGIPVGTGSNFGGLWAAIDPDTGNVLWRTPDPNNAVDPGPVTVVNGVVYGASMATDTPFIPGQNVGTVPSMFAMDASTGKILWSFDAGSSVIAGASIANGTVYWGSGYTHLPLPGFTGNNKFYAFTVNGK
jgi:polyvinyl alcohol dehydrogenase (cytochrome)